MERKKKVLPLLKGVKIERYAAEGKCVAHFDSVGVNGGASRDKEGNQIRKVLFVPFAAEGDVCDVQILKSRSSFAEGKIVNMVEPSPVRVQPMCQHFGVCGGCKWQHIPYSEQLRFKQQQVMDALTRIGKVELPACHPIDGCADPDHSAALCQGQPIRYRNKLEFTFSNKKWISFEEMDRLRAEGKEIPFEPGLGFHIPDSFDKVLDIEQCHLQEEISNEVRLWIRQYAIDNHLTFFDLRQQHGLLRNMVVRTSSTGEKMLIVIFGEPNEKKISQLMGAIHEQFPQFTSLMYVINQKQNDAWGDLPVNCYFGKDHMIEEMEGLKFKVGPKSFYQTNSKQAYELYKHARRFAGLDSSTPTLPQREGDCKVTSAITSLSSDSDSKASLPLREGRGGSAPLVYDLYTGTGTIANFVARNARQVIGIEYVPDAIADAKVNSALNNIDNTLFYAGDMKDILTDDFIAEHGRPDIIITDPPRAGMHEDVVNVILNAAPKVIVYVSCNPATQARDLQLLDVKYKVTDIQPVDMFPHTQHVENVVRLELKY